MAPSNNIRKTKKNKNKNTGKNALKQFHKK